MVRGTGKRGVSKGREGLSRWMINGRVRKREALGKNQNNMQAQNRNEKCYACLTWQNDNFLVLVHGGGGQLDVRKRRRRRQNTGIPQAPFMAQALNVHVQLPDMAPLGDAQVLASHDTAPEQHTLHKRLERLAFLLLGLDRRVLGMTQRR